MTKKEYDDRNYEFKDIPEDPRFRTCFREAATVISFWGIFVALTLFIMYVIGAQDPVDYTYVCGLPLWFFLVCALIACGLAVVIYLVKRVFKDFSLDDSVEE